MTLPAVSFLDALDAQAKNAEAAETAFRAEASRRIRGLETERVFAYRRLNLMRATAAAVADAESEEIAVANALAVLRTRLGWDEDSETRSAVLARFAPVIQALYACLDPGEPPPGDVPTALAAFEAWYAMAHPVPFWALFETYFPETPRVDF